MTNKEFESLIVDDMSQKMRASYFMLLSNCVELYDENTVRFAELKKIERAILKTAVEMEEILNKDDAGKLEELRRLNGIRAEFSGIASEYLYILARIELAQDYMSVLRDDSELLKSYDQPVWMEEFRDDCIKYAENITESDSESIIGLGKILSLLPIKMTKEKYFDYLRRGLREYELTGAELQALVDEKIKPEFNPYEKPWQELPFPELNEELYRIWEGEEQNPPEEYDELLENARLAWESLKEHLVILHESINYCVIVLSYAPTMDFLIQDDFVCRDLVSSFKENVESDNIELFADTMNEKLEEIIEELMDEDYEDQIEERLEKNESIPKNLQTVFDIRESIHHFFMQNLDDFTSWLPFSKVSGEERDKESVIEDFIRFAQENLTALPIKKQRLLRQRSLGIVITGFRPKEWIDYIIYVYEAADYDQKKRICQKVYKFFETEYFYPRLTSGDGFEAWDEYEEEEE